MNVKALGPFTDVLDVGGNVGVFAERCRLEWPAARITSFEPVPVLADQNRRRADGRWWVEQYALSSKSGDATISYCVNQHSASTMQTPGDGRATRFGIRDRFDYVPVRCAQLDAYQYLLTDAGNESGTPRRVLLKVDVEGHELEVLRGGPAMLEQVDVAVVEVNQVQTFFLGSPSFAELDTKLVAHGLVFVGVAGAQFDPSGAVVQFDGVWTRHQ